MTSEEMDAIVIREFLKTLTEEEIVTSVHLIGMDFNLCEIDDIVDSAYSLYLEYQELKRKVKLGLIDENSDAMNDYKSKKVFIKKLFSCDELHSLVFEKMLLDYLEQRSLTLKY